MSEVRPTFLMVPGAGSDTWYWHRLIDELGRLGHRSEGVELPCTDDGAGLNAYRTAIVDSMPVHGPVVLVAHSFGTFSASLAAVDERVRAIVLVAPMIPAPGETGGDWWASTGHAQAVADLARADGRDPGDFHGMFLDDVPVELHTELLRHTEDQSGRPFEDPWPLRSWPSTPTAMIVGVDDRFFPLALQRRLARERLGIAPIEITGGHMLPLSQPETLGEQIVTFVGQTFEHRGVSRLRGSRRRG